jgi:hypothetical protein
MMNLLLKIVLAIASCLKQDENQPASRGRCGGYDGGGIVVVVLFFLMVV